MKVSRNGAHSIGHAAAVVSRLICVALMFGAAGSGIAQAGAGNLMSAINDAGRQRMLTQRIVLTYCQMGLKVIPRQAEKRLVAAVELFDAQLAKLKTTAPDRRVRDTLEQVELVWQPFKTIATGPVDKQNARRLLFLNDDLLYAAHKVVQALQDFAGTAQARLVNISGRQRMLSQRMAKFYMLREWGLDSLSIRGEMETAKNEFASALRRLKAAPENSAEIRAQLDRVSLQWAWFENALTLTGEEPYRLVVADSSEEILAGFERITELYERLSTR